VAVAEVAVAEVVAVEEVAAALVLVPEAEAEVGAVAVLALV
jgi:hypothetical protein